ncbi:MFS transporter [Actinopolymorpha pittospori]|uniref:MFS family permease n=1 Tax=Actinopolymorpha pittospori TaxID=648752 RepID=A0A927MY08_9ACTN|nr:MFS family permease [Actinopolymorpha pittospori]
MSITRQAPVRRAQASATGRPWLPVVAAMFCCGWGGNQFTPLLLMYRQQAGYSEVTVDAFLAAYVLGLVPGLLVAGPASDRYGRKPLLTAGTALSLAASAVLAGGVAGAPAIYAGRLLAGAAAGVAMAVGTSWAKELSQPPYDPAADTGSGARRASLALTLGFGLGAGVAGVLAQWGPWPMVTPYVVHVLIVVPALLAVVRAPETRPRTPEAAARSLWADLRIPAAGRRRFVRVVVPMAPWIFGSAGVAYAVTPELVRDRLGHLSLGYATGLTVLMLGTGAVVQPLVRRLESRSPARTGVGGMVLMACGMGLCAVNAVLRSPPLGAVGAVVLGGAYGVVVISGLLEIQRIARPDDLAGLTGVYYALAYTGFLLPAVLASVSAVLSYPVMLAILTGLAVTSLALVARGSRLPASAD